MKCDGCNLESEREEIFKSVNRFFRSKDLTLCPACFERKDNRTNLIIIWSYLICGGLSIPLTLYYPTSGIGLLFLTVSVFQLFVLISTVLHELGHAMAGRLVGMRVFGIEIGKGPVVYDFLGGGIRWRIRAIAFGGVTYGMPFTTRLFRLKELAFVLGGPMANAILLFVAIKLLPFDEIFKSTALNGFMPMTLLALSNFILLIVSLWPYMANSIVGKIPSDGLLLWKVWWFKKEQVENTLAARYLYEAIERQRQKDLAGAQKWIDDGLLLFPNNFRLRYTAAEILYANNKYPEAVRAFALLLGRHKINGKPDKNLESYILNFIAYIYLLMGKPEFLSKADTCSRLALEKMPWVIYHQGTRGGVLVELGKYEEGLKLLHNALRNHPEKTGKALDACHIAIAEARRGNLAESHNYFTLARKLDPDCILLEREATVKE